MIVVIVLLLLLWLIVWLVKFYKYMVDHPLNMYTTGRGGPHWEEWSTDVEPSGCARFLTGFVAAMALLFPGLWPLALYWAIRDKRQLNNPTLLKYLAWYYRGLVIIIAYIALSISD